MTPQLKGSKQEKMASKVKNVQWATQHCKFGWHVNGIFRADQNGFSIYAVDRANGKDLLVTGESNCKLNLWRYPANVEVRPGVLASWRPGTPFFPSSRACI